MHHLRQTLYVLSLCVVYLHLGASGCALAAEKAAYFGLRVFTQRIFLDPDKIGTIGALQLSTTIRKLSDASACVAVRLVGLSDFLSPQQDLFISSCK